jgi:hypothetical protein
MASTTPSGTPATPVLGGPLRTDFQQQQKILERALDLQEDLQKRFSRELKLVLFIVVAFHFLVLLRSVTLLEESRSVEHQIGALTEQETAVHELQSRLQKAIKTLSSGRSKLTNEVASVPQQLNARMKVLDSELQELRRTDSRSPERMTVQSSAQVMIANSAPGLISILPSEQRQELTSSDPRVVRAALIPIVRARILEPAFHQLDAEAKATILVPFAASKEDLLRTMKQYSATLERAGIENAPIVAELDHIHFELQRMRFETPASDQWWMTYSGKLATLNSENVNMQRVSDSVLNQLSNLTGGTSRVELRLLTLLSDAEHRQESTEQGIKKLEDRNGELQGLIADTAKPLKLVTLQLDESVRYFPVAVAAALGYLTLQYFMLLRRARRLALTFKEFRLTSGLLELYFDNASGFSGISSAIVVAAFTVMVGLVFWGAHRISASAALGSAAPHRLYLAAKVLSLVFLGVCFTITVIEYKKNKG